MTTATLPDLYTALGVPRDASEMEIRGAYGRVVLAARESAHAAPSRELLDFALSTLTDPELRARYDAQAPVRAAATDPMADGAYVAEAAFQHARNGALWFAGGGLVTVLSYIGSGTGGKYFIAWGAVLFGAYQLLRGLFVYLGAPAAARTGRQMAVLGVLAAVGALSSGWVIANETGVVQDPTTAAWGAAIDKAEPIANKAADLFRQVSDRPGAWSTQDSTDMRQVSQLYGQVAELLKTAPVDASLTWYRDGLASNYREAAAVTGAYAALTTQSSQTEFEALNTRWSARISDLQALSDRFSKQLGAAR
ncbi:MAG: hypothetical protein ABJB39_00815 [Chloroflexota bacterium]